MIYGILSVALVGSLYGNYWFYQKLKLAEAGIAQLTSAAAATLVANTAKAAS